MLNSMTREELFVIAQNDFVVTDVLDVRHMTRSEWKHVAKDLGYELVLWHECRHCGLRVRIRSSVCLHCRPHALVFQRRHRNPGYVYLARSRSGDVIKIGTTQDINDRYRQLRAHRYGGFADWEMVGWAHVDNAGRTENSIWRALPACLATGRYSNDGRMHDAREMFHLTARKAWPVFKKHVYAAGAETIERDAKL